MPESRPLSTTIDFERAEFRSNAKYDLVLFDRLASAQQELLADLKKQPDFYGVLLPVGETGMTVKSVGRDTALLYLTLKEAGPLPQYARALAAADAGAGIARLVLDQILEIRQGERFVSGAEAYELFYGQAANRPASNRLQRLSLSALQYGERLALTDPIQLSLRLYNYHRLPITKRWREALPDKERVAERLGVNSAGRFAEFVAANWRSVNDADAQHSSGDTEDAGWLSWAARRRWPTRVSSPRTYKLYISPLPEFIENVFAVALRALTGTAVLQLKIGANVEGLLRPDKIVAYFADLDELRRVAGALAPRLQSCPAQGVPFTAALDDDGLLSWGVDPPASEHLLDWQPRESWRLWLTNRLANALLTAKRSPPAEQRSPWQYALDRLQLEGVDTETWTPRDTLWNRQTA